MGFVKSYVQRFAYSSVTTEDWKTYLFSYFKDKVRNLWLGLGGLPAALQVLVTPWPLAPRRTS